MAKKRKLIGEIPDNPERIPTKVVFLAIILAPETLEAHQGL